MSETTTQVTATDSGERELGQCPVLDFQMSEMRPAGGFFEYFDELRPTVKRAWVPEGEGYWILLDDEACREAYQDHETFTTESTIVNFPEPDWHWIPLMEGGKRHTDFRKYLNRAFSPRIVRAQEEEIREDCRRIIERFRADGKCDFVTQFAMEFPTLVFLRQLNLPVEDAPQFMEWVEATFSGLSGSDEHEAAMTKAREESTEYFRKVLADRRANPRPAEEEDFFTIILESVIEGEPITDDDFLNLANVLILAGLDTVKSQLGYMFLHLADTPSDRERIRTEEGIISTAVEEFLRAHTIVNAGRKLSKDVEFHGCPMKKGDMVLIAASSSSRDEDAYENGTEVQLDRKINRHLAFAAGPHRCAGAHLARLELGIALEEWHKLIPDYRAVRVDELRENGPQLGLDALHLEWDL